MWARIRILVVLGLAFTAGMILVNAQGGDVVLHNTSWTFQNLGGDVARVSIDFYDLSGVKVTTDNFTVSKSISFWAPSYPALDDVDVFNGSAVVKADQSMASIANQVAANESSSKIGNATYRGTIGDNTSSIMYAPVLMKNFGGKYWTVLNIQSTVVEDDTPIWVHYYNEQGIEIDGSPISYTLEVGSPLRVSQRDSVILPDGFIGSAIVEAIDGVKPISLIVNEFVGVSNRMYDEFYSYEGFTSGSTRIVLPALFVNGYGVDYQSSTSIQNLAGPTSPATVTWRFYDTTPANPNAATEIYSFTETVTTSKSVYFPDTPYVQRLKDGYQPGDDAWVGSITLESSEPLVAIVNELNLPYHAASYVGFSTGATELFFPLAFVKAYGFANTSFSIADVSDDVSEPVTVTVTYIADKEQCPSCSNTVDVYSFSNIDSKYQPTHLNEEALKAALSPSGVFVGSIHITATKPINGIMNEVVGGFDMDNFTSFNAFVMP